MDVTAVCERSGDWWAVSVPEVPGAFTQAKRLDQVPAMVADAVSLLADVPAKDVHVTLNPQIPGTRDWVSDLEAARRLEEDARRLQAQASASRSGVLRALAAAGLSARDMGKLTGISHQRVSQLLTVASGVSSVSKAVKSGVHRTKAEAVAAAHRSTKKGKAVRRKVEKRAAASEKVSH